MTRFPERFDLVLLGIGSDGHTASLFPGHEDELADPGPLVYVPVPGLPPPHPRITFSLPYLNSQPLVALLVSGEAKREVLGAACWTGTKSFPPRACGLPRRSSSPTRPRRYPASAASSASPTASTSASAPGRPTIWIDAGRPSSAGPHGESERGPARRVERPGQADHPLAEGEVAETDGRGDHRHRRCQEDVEAVQRLQCPPAVGLPLRPRGLDGLVGDRERRLELTADVLAVELGVLGEEVPVDVRGLGLEGRVQVAREREVDLLRAGKELGGGLDPGAHERIGVLRPGHPRPDARRGRLGLEAERTHDLGAGGHRDRHGADGVEAGGERKDTVRRHEPPRRLEADDPAAGCREPDRAGAVRPEGDLAEARSQCGAVARRSSRRGSGSRRAG